MASPGEFPVHSAGSSRYSRAGAYLANAGQVRVGGDRPRLLMVRSLALLPADRTSLS